MIPWDTHPLPIREKKIIFFSENQNSLGKEKISDIFISKYERFCCA